MKRIIPLFPLSLVIFPKSKYPLHIFEERYKILINLCIENRTGFGILTVNENATSEIGSYCLIQEVIQKYPNGEMDIVVEGTERFIVRQKWAHPDGYLMGNVEVFKDHNSDFNYLLLSELEDRFRFIIDTLKLNLSESFWNNLKSSELKSFKYAEKTGMNLQQQQELLAIQSEDKRLSYIITHLATLSKFISKVEFTSKLVMNDGYLN
ncbi:MAG: hypothetical protein C0425_10405 [Chlorobiaceae bacterium]|nr:hypothetical protein [Chlorobiaceae bacterium]MBA4310728.1 hypothetical protein [Chlorobiaceae bacterium]